jgi:hypothetical protein
VGHCRRSVAGRSSNSLNSTADSPVRVKSSTLNVRRSSTHEWLHVFIALVVCSLTLSLATRFCNQVASQVHIAKALDRRGVELERQHLTRDTMRGIAQVADRASFGSGVFYSRVVSPETIPTRSFFDESLYSRPPPLLDSLFSFCRQLLWTGFGGTN